MTIDALLTQAGWAGQLPLPFRYMSTGKETYFANRLDPDYAPREVFAFHKPETLVELAKSGETLRQHLRQMPQLSREGLWANQVEAIEGLEVGPRNRAICSAIEFTHPTRS